ncbi:MAG: nucleoside recognition domain-containing protein [bacterium]|jgi:hypothetical protein|nr:nucleoside recognition domain-containing protein [Bacillota bacterium]HHW54174.1 nucleoside recognition protein [Bacillota bacterium]
MLSILYLGLKSSFQSVLKIALIVIPLLIALEILKDSGLLQRISRKVEPALGGMYLTQASAPALVAGVFIGLIYGAGVLYQTRREGLVDSREMTLLCMFLGINHAVVEDAAIFVALGARFWVLIVIRIITAVILTYLLGRWYYRDQALRPAAPAEPGE